MSLDLAIHASRGAFRLDARLRVGEGEVVAVIGPNGAGKSTLLESLAGLHPVTGYIRIDGDDVAALPPHRRPVGWVPQDGALFPHLDVLDNVAFGLGGRRGRPAARAWLARLDLDAFAGRRPAQLSGGQAQRVVLARTLARGPRVLLLDEPLSALDTSARAEVRRALHTHLRAYAGVTLLVSHDPLDVVTLASRVVALEGGVVVRDTPVADVVHDPQTPWLADLLGT